MSFDLTFCGYLGENPRINVKKIRFRAHNGRMEFEIGLRI